MTSHHDRPGLSASLGALRGGRGRPKRLLAAAAIACLAMAPGLAQGAFPGQNGKIAFTRSNQIFVMNPDGTGQAKLTNTVGVNSEPAWSADGTRIAFGSTRDGGNSEIYVMNADGSGQTRLTNNGDFDNSPAWSPDGTRIAFVRNTGVASHVWVMNADGSGQTQVTFVGLSNISPAWSPDGARIAYQTNRDGGESEIYLMNPDGSDLLRLTNNSALDGAPNWSPDGARIAFVSNRDGGDFEIWAMDADGANPTRLTSVTGIDTRPVWSPSGAKIIFISSRTGNQEIFAMNADGSGPANLTNFPTLPDITGDWQPLDIHLGDAKLWLGATRVLGLSVDVRVRIFLNEAVIGNGQINGAGTGTPGFLGALLHTVPLARIGGPVAGNAGETLAIEVALRRSCSGPVTPVSGRVAFWYDGLPIDSGPQRDAGSRFTATVGGLPDDFFPRNSPPFALSRQAGDRSTSISVALDSTSLCPARPFTPVSTWTMVLPGPGLSGEWIAQPTQRCVGGGAGAHCDVSATLRVFNPGSTIAGRTIAQVYLSADEFLDAGDQLVEPALNVKKLDAGEGDEVGVRFRIDGGGAAGKFLIGVVDATDVVAEANEANNVVVSAPIP